MWRFSYTALSLQSATWPSLQNLPLPSSLLLHREGGVISSHWVLYLRILCVCVVCVYVHVCTGLPLPEVFFRLFGEIWELLLKMPLPSAFPCEPHRPSSLDSFLPLRCRGLIPLKRLMEQSQESRSFGPLTSCLWPWVSLFPFLALSFLIFKKRRLAEVHDFSFLFPTPAAVSLRQDLGQETWTQ